MTKSLHKDPCSEVGILVGLIFLHASRLDFLLGWIGFVVVLLLPLLGFCYMFRIKFRDWHTHVCPRSTELREAAKNDYYDYYD